jgi:hypothetical protein
MGGMADHRWRQGRAILVVLILAVVWARPALAARQTASYGTAEECISAKPAEIDPFAWRCMTLPDGKWVPYGSTPASRASSAFGTFLTIAVVWSLVPLAVAVGLARRRRESPGTAVLLTLFLGWIGLAIVYFGQARTGDAVQRVAPQGAPTHDPEGVEGRLRQLDRLRADHLVSDEEYERQRRRIVESI